MRVVITLLLMIATTPTWGSDLAHEQLLHARSLRCVFGPGAVADWEKGNPKIEGGNIGKTANGGTDITNYDAIDLKSGRARMESLDHAVIQAIEQQVLTPNAVADTIEEAIKQVARELKQNPAKPRELEAEARDIRKRLDRLLRLIEAGEDSKLGTPAMLLGQIRRLEDRLKEIGAEKQALQESQEPPDPSEIRRMCGERLSRFKDLLVGDVPVARQASTEAFVRAAKGPSGLRRGP